MCIGKSPLMGCYLTPMSEDARRVLEKIADMMSYIERSVSFGSLFAECFIRHRASFVPVIEDTTIYPFFGYIPYPVFI